MKSFYLGLSHAAALTPGLALILTGAGVPPDRGTLFGGFLEAAGALVILILWLDRARIKALSVRRLKGVVTSLFIVGVVSLISYALLLVYCLPTDGVHSPVLLPLWATGPLKRRIVLAGGRGLVLGHLGTANLLNAVNAEPAWIMNVTIVVLIALLMVGVGTLVGSFGAAAFRSGLGLSTADEKRNRGRDVAAETVTCEKPMAQDTLDVSVTRERSTMSEEEKLALAELLSRSFNSSERNVLLRRLGVDPEEVSTAATSSEHAWSIVAFFARRDRLADLRAALVRERGAAAIAAPADVASRGAPDSHPLKILFLGAAPQDEVRLSLGKEVREIERNLRESEAGVRAQLVQEWAVRAGDLLAIVLRTRPRILHFSGHGSSKGELVFEDDQGNARPAPAAALGRLFASVAGRDGIACVTLNACFSLVQAEEIRAHVPCVIGMRTAIPDDAAIAFSSAFYLALGHGENVRSAFDMACAQIGLESADDADTPVLLCQPGTDASAVMLVQDP